MSCDEGTIQTIRIQEDHVQILNRDDGSRAGQVFAAVVVDRGWIELPDGSRFASPSPAAEACVGGSQSGWECWTHEASGKTLHTLRDELKRRP